MMKQKIKFNSDTIDKKVVIAVEDSIMKIQEKIRRRGISDKQKDNLNDFLDKIGDKIDNLNDKKKLGDAEATSLKKRISKVKNKLDVPKEILQGLIKKRIIHHFVDQMTDEI